MIKALKFGGTSVGSAASMRQVATVIQQERATITVLSAMSGTTDGLLKIVGAAQKADKATVDQTIEMLTQKYETCIGELLTVKKAEALSRMAVGFDLIRTQAAEFKEYTSERAIVAQGELITSAIFTMHLQELGLKAVLINAPDVMKTDEEGRVNIEFLTTSLKAIVTDPATFYVTQGFICTNHRGEIDNLGRGGSDYSAALMGSALDAGEVQIWTDIDGMHNNDPRIVSNTRPIRTMSFDEAAELAYFGAKILHPATIQPCKDKGIAVLLKNTMVPQAQGTRISATEDVSSDFHAVAAKDGITVIRIYSTRMLMAYGFLRRVFEVFESHRTPIDMITTSEVAVSLTVDNDTHVEEIARDLAEFGKIEIERDNTIVCIVGQMEHNQKGLAARVFDCVKTVPIKMISYGASHHSMAVLIETKHKKETLQSLNDGLFDVK